MLFLRIPSELIAILRGNPELKAGCVVSRQPHDTAISSRTGVADDVAADCGDLSDVLSCARRIHRRLDLAVQIGDRFDNPPCRDSRHAAVVRRTALMMPSFQSE
jgi:hypothetical protein